MAEGPNSLDSEAAVRPDRAKATICRLNSGVYRIDLSAIVNSSISNGEVSTKPGQLHFKLTGRDELRRKYDPAAKTYWITRAPPGPDGPSSFPRQF
jgi:hypothetical protein